MSRLPPAVHEYLTRLASLKEAMEHGSLTPAQKNLAESVLSQVALTGQRKQYIADFVAQGWTDPEIRMAFASPDSEMTILLSAFNENDTVKKFQDEIAAARKEYATGGEDARLKALVRQRHQLLETVWGAISTAGPAHQKPLLDRATSILQGIAELEGLQHARAGRVHTKQPAAEGAAPAASANGDDPERADVNWDKAAKEFVPDEADD